MTTRTTINGRDANFIAAIDKHLSNVPNLPLAGSAYTPAALKQLFQSHIDAANAATAARANLLEAAAAYRSLSTKITPVVRGLRQYAINAFGVTSPVLADFGFTAPKRTPMNAEQIAARTAKSKATRTARMTMGKRQKQGVHGDVTGIIVTPITAGTPAGSTDGSTAPATRGTPPTAPPTETVPAPAAGTTGASTTHTP